MINKSFSDRVFMHRLGLRFFSASLLLSTQFAISPVLAEATVGSDSSSQPAATIAREETPDWVVMREVPEATKARLEHATEGTAYLLSDSQVRITPQGHDDWLRVATRVVERSGLEQNGKIETVFNPHFETVSLDFVHVIRNGRVIDLTGETNFRVVEHEDSLDEEIVSGTLKAVAYLRDIRVGDTIDYAYTMHAHSTLWPGQFYDVISQRYSDPLAMRAIRYLWPSGITPQMKAHNSSISFSKRPFGGGTEWTWTEVDPPAMRGESDVAEGAYQWGKVDISTMNSWSELAQWGAQLYVGDNGLTDEFLTRLDDIAKAYPSPADRLTEVTRYVQDNIRYVGEELGEGSYVPRRPRTVLQRGYGDCKDKSLLLAVALRHLGIEAVPALVTTTGGLGLKDRLPSPLLFDHVIVRAVIDGKIMWIDATGTHRGGRGQAIVPANFGFALPLVAGQSGLEPIEGYAQHAGGMDVLEQFTVDEDDAVPFTLHVETRYTGAHADGMRATVADGSAQTITRQNLDFYRKRFAGLVEAKPLEIRDDRDANELVTVENYALSKADFDSDKILSKLPTSAYAVSDILPDRQTSPRQQPLALPRYVSRDQIIELVVKNRKLGLLEDVETQADGITFARKSSQSGDTTRIDYHLVTGGKESVPASDANDVYAISDKIKDEVGLEFYIDKSAHLTEPASNGLDQAALASIRPALEKALTLMQKGDDASAVEALTLMSGMADKFKHPSPEAGFIEGLKGATLAQLRRPGPALAALRSATEQYDGNAEVFRLWLAFEIDGNDARAMVKALRRTQQAQPQIVTDMRQDWVRKIFQEVLKLPPAERQPVRQDVCIALVDANWELKQRTGFGSAMLDCAIEAHSLRGELDQARAGLALGPEAAALARLSLDRRDKALWPDLDRLGADGFRKSLEQDVERAAAAAQAAPRDAQALTAYVHALRAIGRPAAAIAAGKPFAADKAQVEAGGEHAFWLVNEYSAALRDAGRPDEGLAALDAALALGIDSYPSLASIAINRAGVLNDMGRHQQALEAATALDEDQSAKMSPFGRMWVWAERACALRQLSRQDEAKTIEAKMAEKPEDNWNAMVRVAACRNDVSAISDIIVTRLKDEEKRSETLGLFLRFQASQADLPFAKQLHEVVAAALRSAAVQQEFLQTGRVVTYAGTTAGWSDF